MDENILAVIAAVSPAVLGIILAAAAVASCALAAVCFILIKKKRADKPANTETAVEELTVTDETENGEEVCEEMPEIAEKAEPAEEEEKNLKT